jgi:MFS family permease
MKGFSRFHPQFSAGMVSLYSNRLIIQFGAGLLGLFFPIFLYEYFGNAPQVMLWFFLVNFGLGIFLFSLGAKLMKPLGLKRMMIIATLFYATYHAMFIFLDNFQNVWLFLFVALIVNNIWRMLYWSPFHTEFAEFTDKRHRGRTIAFLTSISSLVSIAVPILAAFIIANFGFDALFLVSGLIILSSVIPLFFSKPVYEEFSFGYFETFKKLFAKKRRRMLYAYMADGADSIVGFLIWPIFIFEVLNGNYLEVGIISTLIILVSVFLQIIMGDLVDHKSKKKLLKLGTAVYSIGWVIKIFVNTAFTIFIASTFHSFALIMMRTPFDALMYEKAADAGHYVDEYTVLRDIAITLGRVLMILAIIVLLYFVSLPFAFLLAAVAALFINMID